MTLAQSVVVYIVKTFLYETCSNCFTYILCALSISYLMLYYAKDELISSISRVILQACYLPCLVDLSDFNILDVIGSVAHLQNK